MEVANCFELCDKCTRCFDECYCSGDRMAGIVDAIQESGLGGLDLCSTAREWSRIVLVCRVPRGVDLSSNSRGDRVMLKLWFSWLF